MSTFKEKRFDGWHKVAVVVVISRSAVSRQKLYIREQMFSFFSFFFFFFFLKSQSQKKSAPNREIPYFYTTGAGRQAEAK